MKQKRRLSRAFRRFVPVCLASLCAGLRCLPAELATQSQATGRATAAVPTCLLPTQHASNVESPGHTAAMPRPPASGPALEVV